MVGGWLGGCKVGGGRCSCENCVYLTLLHERAKGRVRSKWEKETKSKKEKRKTKKKHKEK